MNKYQKYLIDKCVVSYSLAETSKEQKCLCNEKIIITQSEDITKTKYTLRIVSGCAEKIYAIKGGIKLELHYKESPQSKIKRPLAIFYCPIDFDDRIDSIEIQFKYDVADSLMIPVVFEEADKTAYYEKKEKENQEALIANAQIKHSTGADLVNIYFQPCCDTYAKTEIELYLAKGHFSRPSGQCITFYTAHLLGGEVEQLIGKYKVEDGAMFKSITGLAKRVYAYKLKQFDKGGNVLIETECAFFKI